ncbi:MAG TPA: electron transfer flavoprotein subunit beta/FixA family protein [Planctomycetota bacterium]|jgi:electron transfer flavoprotein beta subunit|nr:electron transfer flavoprotein subunit beta/FixA family protein [Planctomycetota bacterium]
MNVAVCVKRVPATDTRIRIAPDGRSLDLQGVEFVLNPYDEFAVEEGLRLREKAGSGEVVVLTLGPTEAQKELRTCLAMGADRAVLLKDDALAARDGFAIASILAGALKGVSFDLLLFGKQAVDSDGAQVGGMTATLLGLPCIGEVVKVEVLEGKRLRAEREVEGGREVVEATLPCALTAQKGLNEPRYASLKGIMAAKKKPIEEPPLTQVEPRLVVLEMTLPPPRPPGRIVGKGAAAVPELIRLLREEAKVL